VLTSRYEGFGLVVLESIAHGCPVVAYDVKYGPADIIRDGINGLLVEAGNIDALAAAIIQVLTDTPLRSRLAEGTTTSIADFDPRTFIARWSALCNRLAASTESRFESSSTSDSRPAMFTADRERV
jgi:poly(glycerol-phosphate) alpha-glucosyltransferase